MAAGTHSAQALADALAQEDPGDQVAPFMTFGSTW
jgi:hypothetical protein